MSAVLEVNDRSAKYLRVLPPKLVQHFEQIATAPGSVALLRELILALAVQGKLVRQDSHEESANGTLERSRAEMRERMQEGKAKREKPSAVIVDEELPFSLPCGWQWCRLTDTGEYVNGLAFKASDFLPCGLPVIRIQNLSGRSSEFNRVDGVFPASVLVRAGDILVSWSATLDAFIWRGESGVLNQHIFRVEPSPAVDKGFLYWLLKWAIRDLAASDHAHGLVMSHINRGPFLSKPIGLPPLAEQSRIVARIEELMRLCDALESKGQLEAAQHAQLVQTLLGALTTSNSPKELADNWQRVATHFDLLFDRPEAIDALEQTIQQLAVRGLLVAQDPHDEPARELLKKIRAEKDRLIAEGVIKPDKLLPSTTLLDKPFVVPENWEWCRLVDVALRGPTNGLSPRPTDTPTDVRCLSLSATTQGFFRPECFKYVEIQAAEAEPFRLERGDLLIQRGNSLDYVGIAALYDGPDGAYIFPDLMMRLRLSHLVEAAYVHMALVCNEGRDYFKRNATGTQGTMPKVNQATVGGAPLPLPPAAEMLRIVARVASLRSLCADLRQRLVARQSTQAHLAEALIDEVA